MNYEEITMSEAKGKYRWLWVAYKAQFPNSTHDEIRKMIEVSVAVQKGHIRNEELDEEE